MEGGTKLSLSLTALMAYTLPKCGSSFSRFTVAHASGTTETLRPSSRASIAVLGNTLRWSYRQEEVADIRVLRESARGSVVEGGIARLYHEAFTATG